MDTKEKAQAIAAMAEEAEMDTSEELELIDLELAEGRLAELQKDEAMSLMLELGKMAGRVQATKLVSTFAE